MKMSGINGSILAPYGAETNRLSWLFTAVGVVVHTAAAAVIVAALLVDPGTGYVVKEVPALAAPAQSGLALLVGLPLP